MCFCNWTLAGLSCFTLNKDLADVTFTENDIYPCPKIGNRQGSITLTEERGENIKASISTQSERLTYSDWF